MICFTKASTRTVSTLRVTKTRSLGRDHPLYTFLNAFAGYWLVRLAVVFEQWCVLCFRYFMNLVCNNLRLRVCKWISELLVKCNVWCVLLNDVILVISKFVWNPSWFRLTTGIIWAQVQKFERFGADFCTCALIIWSVLLQLVYLLACMHAHVLYETQCIGIRLCIIAGHEMFQLVWARAMNPGHIWNTKGVRVV
jgi:hypothetical protein